MLLFDDTTKKNKVLRNNVFDCSVDEKSFKEVFFDTLHLIKIKANLKEYSDVNKRYLGLSEIVQIGGNMIRLNTISKLYFYNICTRIKRIAFEKSEKLTSITKIDDISKIFAVTNEDMVKIAQKIYSIDVKTIDEIKGYISNEKLERFKTIVKKRFDNKKLIELFNMLKVENKKDEVSKYVTTEVNLPTVFEYLMAIAWYKISDFEGNPLKFMRLKLDGNLLPVSHATGGDADIVWEYAKNSIYSQHDLLIEVTMLKSSAQKHNEGEPVTRHLGEHILDTRKETYCVFIAPELFRNTISYFINCRTYKYYAAEFKDVVDGMKIISLDIDDVCKILEKEVTYGELYDVFDKAYKSSVDIPKWHEICIKNEIEIEALPGPCAFATALVASGMPTGRFSFEGFLTTNRKNRIEHLESLKSDIRTLIFYEAPHKLLNTLKDMYAVFGEREIVLAREITKKYEEYNRTTLSSSILYYEETPPKGEFVLILKGADEPELKQEYLNSLPSAEELLKKYSKEGLRAKELTKKVADELKQPRREIYDLYLKIKENL